MKVYLCPDLSNPTTRKVVDLDFGNEPPWRVMTDEWGETWLYQYNVEGVPCYEAVQNHSIVAGYEP